MLNKGINMLKNIYVGCGEDRRQGFLHCDIRALEGVDIVCQAWELSSHVTEVTEIYSRHMLEHLTMKEAYLTLSDWHYSLAKGGNVYIVVPNLDFHIQQWLDADWSEEIFIDSKSKENHALAGFYGWQRECDPQALNYSKSYWDVHKSGYNAKLLSFLMHRIGFLDIEITIKNQKHLVAIGKK